MIAVRITREPLTDDVLRASIGGHPTLGYYLVYRGEPEDILPMLKEVLEAAECELDREDRD